MIFTLIEVVRILHTFSLHADMYIVFAEVQSFNLLMVDELGYKLSINLLVSVLGSAGEVCSVV